MRRKNAITATDYLPYLWIAPFFIIFCCWGLAGQYFETHYRLTDLIKESGNISKVYVDTYQSLKTGRETDYAMFVLNDEEYRIRNSREFKIPALIDFLKKSSHVELWRRNRWQQLFGMGYLRDVYQLQVDGRLLFSLEDMRHSATFSWKFIAGIAIFLVALWFYCLFFYFRLK